MAAHTHVIGAGLAGLSAALRRSARAAGSVSVHEAANVAGGRCRSYFDPTLGMRIDNGNHLLLSGNRETADFIREIGAGDRFETPPHADFPFVDLQASMRWTLRLSDSRLPWWIFARQRRVPGTHWYDYLALLALQRRRGAATIGQRIRCEGSLYRRLIGPLLLAALNTEPPEASAELARAVCAGSLALGGLACRPMFARDGLSAALIDPALATLRQRGVAVRLGARLRGIELDAGRARRLDFGDHHIELGPRDTVILAQPGSHVASLLPGVAAPDEFRSIVNAHFAYAPPPEMARVTGVIGATLEWLFAFDDRLSVTVSGADRLLSVERETLAATLWREVTQVADLAGMAELAQAPLPPYRLVIEKRATFAALPAQQRRRPPAATAWRNVFLAGDWTATGLPATIEGAVLSGRVAAQTLEEARTDG